MAIQDRYESQTAQGPGQQTPNTDDGLYPTREGDLGHGRGGDTEPLPGNNEPLIPGTDQTPEESGWDRNDKVDDPDLPVDPLPVDEDEEPASHTER